MRTIATFWSINTTLPPVERYHLGQLSAALYADDVVRSGGRHFAIICDNDALTDDQYSRISEISAAISSLCSEPVIVRTLTSFRINMQAGDRAAATAISSEVWKLRDEVRSLAKGPAEGLAFRWRVGEASDTQFVQWIFPANKPPQLENVSDEHLASMLYLLLTPPVWFEAYWVPAMLFAIGRLAEHCAGAIEIVEGQRNRYPWHAIMAAKQLFEVPEHWWRFPISLNLRPNVKSDGSFKSMCTAQPDAALLIHSSAPAVMAFCYRSSHDVLASIAALILGHKKEHIDQRTVAVELASTLNQVQCRWIFGPERKGALRVASAPASDRPHRRHPVISVHGILSRGVWQKDLSRLFSAEGIPYDALDLGLVQITAVFLPFISTAKARKLADHCSSAEREYKASPSIIAHSFGTLVVQKLLSNYHWITIDKVILSGSIVPVEFDWATLLEKGRVNCVVNLVASQDKAVAAGAMVSPLLGPSGTEGFVCRHPSLFQPVSPDFGHSDWYAGEAFGRVLVPMLEGDLNTVRETLKYWPSIDRDKTITSGVAAAR